MPATTVYFPLVTCLLMAACNPIPNKFSCQMPDFSKAAGLEIQASFATWGYFSERCSKATPKRFILRKQAASLEVLVDGSWLRLSAQDKHGSALLLRAPDLSRGTDIRVDHLKDGQLVVYAVDATGAVVQVFEAPHEAQECTCVTYDAI